MFNSAHFPTPWCTDNSQQKAFVEHGSTLSSKYVPLKTYAIKAIILVSWFKVTVYLCDRFSERECFPTLLFFVYAYFVPDLATAFNVWIIKVNTCVWGCVTIIAYRKQWSVETSCILVVGFHCASINKYSTTVIISKMVHTWQGTRFRQLKQLKQFISNREYA